MGLITYGGALQNEVKAWPPLFQVGSGFDLVTNNHWWDDEGTPTTKATAVPVSGEAGLDEMFEWAIKCVTDGDDEGFLQRYTYADEPRVKSGRVLSAAVWVTTGVSVRLRNSDASETVGIVEVTEGDWSLVIVEAHTCAGTYVELVVTKDTSGTFYAAGGITVMKGANAVELPPRKGVYRVRTGADTAVENLSGQTSQAYTDLDLTAASSPLAFMGDFHMELAEATTGGFTYAMRPNGTSWASGFTNGVAIKTIVEPADVERSTNDFNMLLDDLQIIETALANSGGGTADNARLYLQGYWEWE